MTVTAPSSDYRFGRFELQPAAQQLLVDGEPATLGPRAFALLVALAERAGQLVSKAELLDLVWPGLVVEENNLQVQVSALRKILGADAIATVPGRGYRFTLQVEPAGASPAVAVPPKSSPLSAADLPSVAVLPFVNMSDDATNEYFADGLSEELLNVLSKIRGLRVVSRTSAFTFKGMKADIPTVAQKLNVANILEGSVRKVGTRVRVTVQLVHAATDSHLWSETYDRELEDIFAVQDDIAQSVVKEIRADLMGGQATAPASAAGVTAEVQAAVRGRSTNAEAYRLYLQGRFFLNCDNEEDLKKAIDFFGRAVALDPEYAEAWASLSFCYLHQGANAWAPFVEGGERAREAARRALAAGPDVAASHWAMGVVLMYCDWDWRGAEAAVRRAVQLAPEGRQLLLAARLMQTLGQLKEAAALIEQALALDPLNVEAHLTSGLQFVYAGRPAEAESAYRKAFELSPNQRVRIHYYLGRAHMLQGRLDDALREIEQEGHKAFRLLGIALVQHARGRAAASGEALREMIREYGEGGAYQIAEVYASRGDVDQAFEWLERAYRQRDAGLASIRIDPLLHGLHADARWQPWLQRMRLAD